MIFENAVLFTPRFSQASWREVYMALFILNLRNVVISMMLQKLQPRAIYLYCLDSSDSKALFRKSFLQT